MKKLKIIGLFTVLFMIALISKSNAGQISATEIQNMNPGDTGSITISFDSDKSIGTINLRVQVENMNLTDSQALNGWSTPLNDLENGYFTLLKASGGASAEVLKLDFKIPESATGTASLTVLDNVEMVALDYNKEFVSGFTKSCSIIPASPFDTLTGLRIAENPTKTSYKEGDFFDATGMVVVAQYSNGDEIQTMDFTTTPIRALTTSDKVVTVSYTEDNVTKEAYVSITVTKEDDTTQQGEQIPNTEDGPTLSELRLDKKPNKVAYVEGDTFDATGMVLTAVYSDGTSTQITDYTISSKKALTADDKVIVVSYTAGEVTKEVSIDITVTKKQEANNNAGKTEEKQEKKDNTQVPVEQTPQTGTGKVLVGSMGVCGLIVAASYVLSKKQF